jgi:hypothetical protein
MVHEDCKGGLVVVEVVLSADWLLPQMAALVLLGRFDSNLDEAIVGRLLPVLAVLFQHLLNDVGGRVLDGEEQGLVGHVLAESLAVYLERSARVGASILGAELLQLALQLLLTSATHHRLGVRDGTGERRVRKF